MWNKLNKGLENVITIASGEEPSYSLQARKRSTTSNFRDVKRGGVSDDFISNEIPQPSKFFSGNTHSRVLPPPPAQKHPDDSDKGGFTLDRGAKKVKTKSYSLDHQQASYPTQNPKQIIPKQHKQKVAPKSNQARVQSTSKLPSYTKYAQKPTTYNYYDDDDNVLSRFLNKIPSPGVLIPSFFKNGRDDDDRGYLSLSKISNKADGWDITDDDVSPSFFSKMVPFRKKKSSQSIVSLRKPFTVSKSGANDVIDPVVNNLLQKKKSLLSKTAEKECNMCGNIRAAMDVIALSLGFISTLQFMEFMSSCLADSSGTTNLHDIINSIIDAIGRSIESWFPFTLIACFLTIFTNHVVFYPKIRYLAHSESSLAYSATVYSQLWLRMFDSAPVDESLNDLLAYQAEKEVYQSVAIRRLFVFVAVILVSMAVATISVIRPLLQAFLSGIMQLFDLNSLRVWPISYNDVISDLQRTWQPIWQTLQSLCRGQLIKILDQPFDMIAPACLYLVLLAAVLMPNVERKLTHLVASRPVPEDVAIDDTEPTLSVDTVAAIGSSSANRLQVCSNASSQSILDRWRLMQPATETKVWQRLIRYYMRRTSIRKMLYIIISTAAFSIPFVANYYIPTSRATSRNGE